MAKTASLADLHKTSRCNRTLLKNSVVCGCFYCLNEYKFEAIVEWTDAGETAICPVCGVDAVLGFGLQPADRILLRKMHNRWFEKPTRMTSGEWTKAVERNSWKRG